MNRCGHRARPSPDGLDSRPLIRRAYLLAQMVAALPLLLVAAALLTSGIHAALQSQKRSAEIATGYAAINSLLDTLRQDTRGATAALAQPADTGAFALQTPDGDISYRFAGGRVTREVNSPDARGKAPREWRINEATLTAEFDAPDTESSDQHGSDLQTGSPFLLLTVHIRWRGESQNRVDPLRRLDASFSLGRGYQQ
ncbi:MAG: hypothetical protein GY778_03025 [bacterium]|nr:hypothetical protein [bacterium]